MDAEKSWSRLFNIHTGKELFSIYIYCPIYCHVQYNSTAKKYQQYLRLILPPLTPPARPSFSHLVWVPANPRNAFASINHVVPAVCSLGPYGSSIEDCVFLGLGLCCFMVSHHKDITPGWVECTLCGQWVHDTCMGVTAAAFSLQDDFPCECDCLQNGELKLKSIEYYTTLQVKDLDMDFNMIVDKVAQMHSLRKEFSREANGKNKWALRSGRFGPFTDEFVDTVNTSLITNVGVEKLHLIPNLYMPEV